MGIVYHGIPEQLTLKLQKKHSLTYFVETGTLRGRTAAWASLYFRRVYTIEVSLAFYNQNRAAYGNNGPRGNITFLLGDSGNLLPGALGQLNGPALVWLDAHWSRDLGYDKPETICPVLAEIEAVRASSRRNVVLIDDARLFDGQNGWPTVAEIEAAFGTGYNITTQDDVLICEPK